MVCCACDDSGFGDRIYLCGGSKVGSAELIVLTVLTAGFAAGIGNCFADKDAINAAKEDKKRKKLKKEPEYKNILDDN